MRRVSARQITGRLGRDERIRHKSESRPRSGLSAPLHGTGGRRLGARRVALPDRAAVREVAARPVRPRPIARPRTPLESKLPLPVDGRVHELRRTPTLSRFLIVITATTGGSERDANDNEGDGCLHRRPKARLEPAYFPHHCSTPEPLRRTRDRSHEEALGQRRAKGPRGSKRKGPLRAGPFASVAYRTQSKLTTSCGGLSAPFSRLLKA
jgi:hypothetical protein